MKTTSSHKLSAQLANAAKNKKPHPVVKKCTIESMEQEEKNFRRN